MKSITKQTTIPNEWTRSGLPAWSFFNREMLEEEKDVLFRRHWQLVCHENDLSRIGEFVTFDLAGERALIIRGEDRILRAFHNLCRHRGSRVLIEKIGRCKSKIICPFHGWVYNLDGTLRGFARPSSFPNLDPNLYGLKPIDLEIWHGFIFVRFLPGPQSSVKEILKPFEKEIQQYELASLVPSGKGFWTEQVKANWKCVRDVDNEGYHVPLAHPGLHDLYGSNYFDEPLVGGVSRSVGSFRQGENKLWSVKNYRKILKPKDTLDQGHKNCWLYIGIFPNLVLGLYPDSIIFYQEFPTDYANTIQRGGSYRFACEDRRMRLSRYLSMRIDRLTSKEDEQLIEWTWEASFSSAFDEIVLSDLEYGVKSYHDALRHYFPVLNGPEPPLGMLKKINADLLLTARTKAK